MASHEEQGAYRDAYYDLRDVLAPFITPTRSLLFEGLAKETAQLQYRVLHDELIEDGYKPRENRLLAAIAICDIFHEMNEEIEAYEAETQDD